MQSLPNTETHDGRYRIGVIGAGRVGAVLGARLRAAGHEICAVSARSSLSRQRAESLLPGVRVSEPDAIVAEAGVVILAVPDDELIAVAERLAVHARKGQVFCHTSGRHGYTALEAVARKGAKTIALHPAMTFTGTEADTERACMYGLSAPIEEREFAEEFVADLGGEPMWVAESDRHLYHAALAHGANHMVTLVTQALNLLKTAGADDPASVLRPLLTAALDNTLAYGEDALTGPVARGDITTLRSHADAMMHPDVDDDTVAAYSAMARATSHRAEKAGTISPRTAHAIRDVLQETDWNAMAGIVEALK